MRHILVVAIALLALAVAGSAAAKGPSDVKITGPGLAHPILLTGNAEANTSTRFGRLVEVSGWFPLVFGQSPDPTSASRPVGALGPRYVAVYVVPAGGGQAATVRQELYPFAAAGALAHMTAGQSVFGNRTHGGWYRGGLTLRHALTAIGLPSRAP